MDMVFTTRQLAEKCQEHQCHLYAVFVDLTKACDTVNRSAPWKILRKTVSGFVDIIHSFRDGMRVCVIEGAEKSLEFDVVNGTKQGCMLAPMLFSIFFAMMLLVAFRDCSPGGCRHSISDGWRRI